MGELKVDDWKWNVWEMDKKTGTRKRWLGSISNPKDGFEWLKKQGKDAAKFRINNVPPVTSTMQNPQREVFASSATDIHEGDELPVKHIPGKYDDFVPRAKRTAKVARPRNAGKGTAAIRQVPVVPAKPKTKAEKKLAADAAALLQQHKADEKAEMEASDGEA